MKIRNPPPSDEGSTACMYCRFVPRCDETNYVEKDILNLLEVYRRDGTLEEVIVL